MSLLVKNVLHCFENKLVDVFVENGKINEIGSEIKKEADKVIYGKEKILYPAFSNMHTHAAMTLLRGYADDLPLMVWLQEKIWPLESKMTEEDIYIGTKLACLEMIKTGTTLFTDMYWYVDAAYQAVSELNIRAMLSAVMIDMFDKKRQKSNEKRTIDWFDKYHNKSEKIKMILGPHAVYTVSEEGLKFAVEFAKEKDTWLNIHLSETLKEVENCLKQTGKRPPEYLDSLGFLHDKTMCAHCVWFNLDEIKLFAKRNTVAIHSPVSNMKLAVGGVMPREKMKRAGVRIMLGTDGAASNNNLDMVEEMKIASLLQKWSNNSSNEPSAAEVLSSATAGFEINGLKVGKLQVGDNADFILVNRHPVMTPLNNPVSNLVYAGNGALVDTTVCAGNVLMENSYVEGEEQIMSDAIKTIEKLLMRQ